MKGWRDGPGTRAASGGHLADGRLEAARLRLRRHRLYHPAPAGDGGHAAPAVSRRHGRHAGAIHRPRPVHRQRHRPTAQDIRTPPAVDQSAPVRWHGQGAPRWHASAGDRHGHHRPAAGRRESRGRASDRLSGQAGHAGPDRRPLAHHAGGHQPGDGHDIRRWLSVPGGGAGSAAHPAAGLYLRARSGRPRLCIETRHR